MERFHKQWATMYMMKRNGMSDTSRCPLCEEQVETWEHVRKCGCPVMRLTRSVQLQSMKRALGKNILTQSSNNASWRQYYNGPKDLRYQCLKETITLMK